MSRDAPAAASASPSGTGTPFSAAPTGPPLCMSATSISAGASASGVACAPFDPTCWACRPGAIAHLSPASKQRLSPTLPTCTCPDRTWPRPFPSVPTPHPAAAASPCPQSLEKGGGGQGGDVTCELRG